MTKKSVKCWACKRLKEPSTWSGFGVVITAYMGAIQLSASLPAPYSTYAMVAATIAGLCGLAAVTLGEKK